MAPFIINTFNNPLSKTEVNNSVLQNNDLNSNLLQLISSLRDYLNLDFQTTSCYLMLITILKMKILNHLNVYFSSR